MMNTKFEKSEKPTDEWYTPQELIHCLGEFDLDPATPENRLWNTAKVHYSKTTNGLDKEWFGRVWLNPPYSRPFIELFIRRMAEHNNGIALLFNRCDSKMFQEIIFPKADSIMFLKKRIKFYRPDGTQGRSPGCGSLLISFGKHNTKILERSGLAGIIVKSYKIIK